MSLKNVIILLVVITLSFSLLLLGGAAVMKYYPSLVGFPSTKKDSSNNKQDTLYVENLIKISENKYRQMEQSIAEKSKLFHLIDSLKGVNNKMADSINQVKKLTHVFEDSVGKVQNLVNGARKTNSWLIDSLTKVNILNKNLKSTIDLTKKQFDEQNKLILSKNDTLENKNFTYFAKIYNNSEPASVAKILEQIDYRDAAKILKLMQKKKAGKVIESMLPERAAAILLLSSND
jgi:flagellar motility protein MotE (MotC chaperone)